MATIDTPDNCSSSERKMIEFFVRNNPDSIPYKK